MEIKRTQLVVRGMQQDLSISKFNPEFSYENRNIRITAREDSSLLSITNERGNKVLQFKKAKPTNKLTFKLDTETHNYYIYSESPVYSDITVTCRWYDVDGESYTDTETILLKGTSKVEAEESEEIARGIIALSIQEDDKFIYYSESVPAPENPILDGFEGTCIGYATLNEYIILFTHVGEKDDRIYRIKDLQDVTVMFQGNLNFDLEHLIDTLPVYESEGVQKVYWTDSYNQPRVINFINDPEPDKWGEASYYDFSPSVGPYSFIDVTKNATGGEFAPGVIQYAFTYITDWHGVESNIVNTSSLNYISYNKRAAKEDETCYNSFNIRLSGLDPRYKYIRLYSIHRTSIDTTPTVKIIGEYDILTPDNAPIDYWQLRTEIKNIVQTLNNTPYKDVTWYEQLPKLDPAYDSLVDIINTNFDVNISTLSNGVFTLQELFEFVWKQKSNYVELVDTGLIGVNEDPTALLYKNASGAVVSTMAAKDSTLFVGGYSIPSEANTNPEFLKIYQRDGTTIVPITWWNRTRNGTRYLEAGPNIYLENGVASDIELEVLWNDNIVPKKLTILKGETIGSITWDTSSTGIESIKILNKKEGQAYYSDDRHIYYLQGVESYPSDDVILDTMDGLYQWGYRDYTVIEDNPEIGTYTYTPYILDKESTYCKQFKKGQPYRFALQGQYENGRWGDPIVIKNIEDIKTLKDEDGKLTEVPDDSFEMDNVCPLSFLVDPILSQKCTPQYTLTDVTTTRVNGDKMSNLVEVSTQGYFDKVAPPLADSFWYFPMNFYKEGDASYEIRESQNLFELPNPWPTIYNKNTVINSGGNLEEIPLSDTANYVNFKTRYTVNGKHFFSLWAGNLQRPQTSSRFTEKSKKNELPFDLGDAIDIPNDQFEGNFTTLYLNKLSVTISAKRCKELYDAGYRRLRLLYVVPTKANRKYPAQGIVTNTVFWPKLRASNACWAYTDYLSRPKELYRVYNEDSKFFAGWSVRVGDMRLLPGDATSWTGNKARRMTGHPYFYPFIHRFTSDYSDEWNKVWNMRPNYGHLMSTFHELDSERIVDSGKDKNFPTDNNQDGFVYDPTVQAYSPCLTVGDLVGDDVNLPDAIFFDESIVDFWSPDVEYQEVDKNYFENTVEGFQIRGMSCVTNVTNSNYKLKEDSTVYGLLGYSDAAVYYPFSDTNSLDNKQFIVSDYTNTKDVSYLPDPQFIDITAGVHRLYLTPLGKWSLEGSIKPHMWETLRIEQNDTSIDKDSQFSYKKYCLNTLMFKDLISLYYDINQPSLFIKGDGINSINYYKTAYSGDDVTYNPGMDELLYSSKYNIPIQYKANTHLTFSLAKGDLLTFSSNEDIDPYIDKVKAAFPVIPELSAYAKQHDNVKIIGQAGGDLTFVNIYWWPSKKSYRPDLYKNEPYSVSDSYTAMFRNGKGEGIWKIAIEASRPAPTDITLNISYRLGFWKSSKKSQLGRTTITLQQGQMTAIKKFKQDFTTLRDWSTIEVVGKSFKDPGENSGWHKKGDYCLKSDGTNADLVVLADNKTYFNQEVVDASDPYWLGKEGIYIQDMFDPIQEEILASEYDNVGIQSIIYHRNLPHFLLVDLVRSDAYIYSDWIDSGLYQQVWVPCGKPVAIPPNLDPDPTKQLNCVVEATEGDIFVGRYDCLRTVSDSDKVEKVNDIVSFICESYVNPDGRADVNRYRTDTRFVNFDNWNVLNPVYDQVNNYFNFTKNDYRVLEHSGLFPNQFSWTLPKYPNSLVDNWANLTFASTYNLEGEYGKLTKLIMHNNQLYAFQDKAISNILFNTRAQVSVSDGLPIELGNSNKVDGVRYITTTSGAQNKWSIAATRSGIYYIDHIRKKLNLITAESIREVTNSSGFSKWALNNFGYSLNELNLQDGMSNWMVSKDSIHDDVYIHDKNECLVFSEKLAAFTSFFDYKDIPFMFRWDNKFLSIFSENNSTEIYEQNVGQYNQFYGKPKVSSYIDYIVNPEMSRDKIFNNIEFRADAFSIENGDYTKYVPNRTLDHIHVRNEFQDTGDVALKQYKNLQKKFRIWRAYIPRDVKEVENYKLNRIRNPWIKMKLSYTPTEEEDNKLVLHDLIVNYTV